MRPEDVPPTGSDHRTTVDYYFSFLSLWSYVGSLEFAAIVQRNRLHVNYKPMNLMAVFAATGGKPVKERPLPRQAYRLVEMRRWARIRGIPLVLHPRFYPADPAVAHRVLLRALAEGADVAAFAHAGLKAVWADELDIADCPTIIRLAEASGLDGARLLAESDDPAILERQQALTRETLDRQVFGAPFYFVSDEPFWGQDRLAMLEETVAARA